MSKNRDKPKFVIDFPELAKQWHPTKNGDFNPENASMWSKKKVWWRCDKGPDHVWETTVEARTYKRTRCPFCRGLKPSVTNSLASIHPGLAKQWHPTKNQELKPNMVITGSHKSVWWSCDEGPDHIWKTEIRNRTGKRKTGCPFCAGKKLSITNSLSTMFPELIDEWFQEKNGRITPEMVKFNTSKAFWWSCDKGPDHIWKTKVGHRTGKTKSGCPFCQNLKLSVTNSLASCYPELAKEWHQERNGDITPDKVVAGSGQLYWWKCDKGPDHVWKATPNTRTNQKRGCPFCAGQKVSVTNSLASCYPELAKEWHQEKNGEITPDKITARSSKYFWWKCDKGSDHVWKATLANRTRNSGGGCPFCIGQKVSVTNSLASLHPDLVKEWYQEKNGKITPDKVVAGSGKLFWWKCDKGPDHEWKTSPHNRTSRRATGCPYCNLGDVELIGYLWERICHRIAQQLLKEEKWFWQPKIETPDFGGKNWIVPEILIEKPDGLFEIIEVKKSPYILTFKDSVIYPQYASKVIFWCLNVETPIEIDSKENFVFISSDELVEQLKHKTTEGNKRTISRIINDIKKLKEGTLLSQQKLLTEFNLVDE